MNLKVLLLGRCQYEKALAIQYDILEKRQKGETEDTLIMVEHPPVITLGRHAEQSNVIVSEEFLNNQGIYLYKTNRGGDVTYHGCGQAVGYPIINLRDRRMGIKKFVTGIEDTFINLLKKEFNIEAGKDDKHTGVWVGDEKIVAIGLAVKQRVTMHGFAFNVNTNLDHFKLIVPCGIADKSVTSLKKITGDVVNFDNMNKLTIDYFCKNLGYDSYDVTTVEQ
ncbi:MAG: lipoyl(octanoyl) transferase LipB [Natronincolaceae bacterium]|jgi:lipoyl(octanoyl) transferase|nr:lipoyl(octanoyl) transferase LipB [Bacillota bacterium]NLK90042.1 lipoyl(octanoyl) transferase LipB [Clostridiales bacterium]